MCTLAKEKTGSTCRRRKKIVINNSSCNLSRSLCINEAVYSRYCLYIFSACYHNKIIINILFFRWKKIVAIFVRCWLSWKKSFRNIRRRRQKEKEEEQEYVSEGLYSVRGGSDRRKISSRYWKILIVCFDVTSAEEVLQLVATQLRTFYFICIDIYVYVSGRSKHVNLSFLLMFCIPFAAQRKKLKRDFFLHINLAVLDVNIHRMYLIYH